MLKNPIYTGKVWHKDKIYDGEHEAIIDQPLFDEVQSIFAANRSENALGKKSSNPSLLAGLIIDPDGRPMTPTHACNGSKRFRYYVTRLEPGDDKNQAWRLPSGEIERLVADALAKAIANTVSVSGKPNPALSDYSRRYLGQLVRISWLAPDIIGAIMDGTQPVNLTGRKLTRANAIPLDWPSQRKMFGVA